MPRSNLPKQERRSYFERFSRHFFFKSVPFFTDFWILNAQMLKTILKGFEISTITFRWLSLSVNRFLLKDDSFNPSYAIFNKACQQLPFQNIKIKKFAKEPKDTKKV